MTDHRYGFDSFARMAELREEDPHGLRPNNELERQVDIENAEWLIDNLADLSDVRDILRLIVRHL